MDLVDIHLNSVINTPAAELIPNVCITAEDNGWLVTVCGADTESAYDALPSRLDCRCRPFPVYAQDNVAKYIRCSVCVSILMAYSEQSKATESIVSNRIETFAGRRIAAAAKIGSCCVCGAVTIGAARWELTGELHQRIRSTCASCTKKLTSSCGFAFEG